MPNSGGVRRVFDFTTWLSLMKNCAGHWLEPGIYGQQSSKLLARDQAQSPAFRAGEHGPIGVVFLRRGRRSPAQRSCRAASFRCMAEDSRVLQPFRLLEFTQTNLGPLCGTELRLLMKPALLLRDERDGFAALLFLARMSATASHLPYGVGQTHRQHGLARVSRCPQSAGATFRDTKFCRRSADDIQKRR